MNYILAFVVGGLICVAVQILMDNTKLLPGRIMVILVCLGAVLGAVGIYEPFSKWAGAGATVPLLGFGNTLWKGMKEAIDKEGFIGLFKRRFYRLFPSGYQRHLYLDMPHHLYLSRK